MTLQLYYVVFGIFLFTLTCHQLDYVLASYVIDSVCFISGNVLQYCINIFNCRYNITEGGGY